MRGCGGAWRARADEDRRDRYDFWRSVSLRARTATDVPRAVPATRESRGHDRRSLVWTSLTSPSDAARATRAIRRSEQRTRHCTAIRRRMGMDSVIEAQLLLTLWDPLSTIGDIATISQICPRSDNNSSSRITYRRQAPGPIMIRRDADKRRLSIRRTGV